MGLPASDGELFLQEKSSAAGATAFMIVANVHTMPFMVPRDVLVGAAAVTYMRAQTTMRSVAIC